MQAKISNIELTKLAEPVKVYNFEVEEFHTYYVSKAEVLAHNVCGPKNYSPDGAGRKGAFKEAKRNSDIPVSQQPEKATPAVDKRGNRIPGRDYDFGEGKMIRDRTRGHDYPDDPTQNRGPHLNDPAGNHYDY